MVAAGRTGGKASQLDELASKGEAIAASDPLSAELRSRQAEGAGQHGFDIGMAAAEGQTAPGPRKQRIHDALAGDEQAGYDAAVAFSLERNRNADLAAKTPPSPSRTRTLHRPAMPRTTFSTGWASILQPECLAIRRWARWGARPPAPVRPGFATP